MLASTLEIACGPKMLPNSRLLPLCFRCRMYSIPQMYPVCFRCYLYVSVAASMSQMRPTCLRASCVPHMLPGCLTCLLSAWMPPGRWSDHQGEHQQTLLQDFDGYLQLSTTRARSQPPSPSSTISIDRLVCAGCIFSSSGILALFLELFKKLSLGFMNNEG